MADGTWLGQIGMFVLLGLLPSAESALGRVAAGVVVRRGGGSFLVGAASAAIDHLNEARKVTVIYGSAATAEPAHGVA